MSPDLVNTVSPTYARESLTPEYGAGLDDVLRDRGDRYIGIMNGVDPQLWDPATDTALAAGYSAADPSGKAACRDDLCARLGIDPDGPVMGVIGRLDPQKGFDLVTWAAPGSHRCGRPAGRPGHGRPHPRGGAPVAGRGTTRPCRHPGALRP